MDRQLRAAARFAEPASVVLTYHSVVEDSERTATPSASPIHHRQMSALARRSNPVSIEEVRKFAAERATAVPSSAAVTFDDGFADNHDVVLPILSRYGIPATFYIMVNAVETGTPPWYCHSILPSTPRPCPHRNQENGRIFEIASADGRRSGHEL